MDAVPIGEVTEEEMRKADRVWVVSKKAYRDMLSEYAQLRGQGPLTHPFSITEGITKFLDQLGEEELRLLVITGLWYYDEVAEALHGALKEDSDGPA